MNDEYKHIAKSAVEEFILWNKTPVSRAGYIICDEEHFRGIKLSQELYSSKHALFVVIKKDNKLRGCIGTLYPTEPDTASEIIRNAIAACSKDMRFDIISKEELPLLEYNVLVVKEIIDLKSSAISDSEITAAIDVKKEGLLIKSGYRQGLVLPQEDGINSAEEMLKEALLRGNIELEENPSVQKISFE